MKGWQSSVCRQLKGLAGESCVSVVSVAVSAASAVPPAVAWPWASLAWAAWAWQSVSILKLP